MPNIRPAAARLIPAGLALIAMALATSLVPSSWGAPPKPPAGSTPGARGPGAARGSRSSADVVLVNGAVYTMDAVRSWAEAVAIKGDTIVYAGPASGAGERIGPRTRVVDLKGRMVLPAFQDAHIHPISGGIAYNSCALYDVEGKEAYVRTVRDYAARHPDKPWIRGDGWSLDAFSPTGIPDKALLDAVVSDRPVYLESSDGHSAWVNSKALRIAGITKDTPDPAGGRIDRDAKTGEPVGGLQDEAMNLVARHIPPFTPRERIDGLRYALKMLNGYGITAFQDANAPVESLETYRTLDQSGELTARVVASLWWDRNKGDEQIPGFLDLRHRFTRGRLRATTVKIMQDGVMEVQTAALLKPYLGKPGVTGLVMVDPEKLKGYATRLDKEGFQIHFHAIGDAAIRHCLDAVEAARRANGSRDARHHISHLELLDPSDIPRFRTLGVIANFQPLWALTDGYMKDLTLPFLEPERARWLYPIRSLQLSGAVLAFGSDWSVSSANPLEEIEVAVLRRGPAGETKETFIPEERIDLRDALAAFTIGSAYVNFLDQKTGSIEAGKVADLIVLDRNLFNIPPEQISETKVLLTLLDGKPVHGGFDL